MELTCVVLFLPKDSDNGHRMTDSRKRREKSPRDPEERRYMELIYEVKSDKSQLEREIAVMREKRAERDERVKFLRQEINILRDTLSDLQTEKDISITRLKNELVTLTSTKLGSVSGESKESNVDEWRSTKSEKIRASSLGSRRHKRASVSSVPMYDRKLYRRKWKDRSRAVEYDGSQLSSPRTETSSRRGSHSESRRWRRARANSQGNRRRKKSPRAEIQITQDKIEAAAQAFLDIFGQLNPKLLKSLWKRSPDTEKRGNERILHISRLGAFLHGLVVDAFKHDNPEHPAPSVRRTKPLVSLLIKRLSPNIEGLEYLSLVQFKMFPVWLESPAMSANDDVQGDPSEKKAESDIDRRQDLKEGDSCLIWSDREQVWHEGQVTSIKFDEQGEWLVVRYNDNSTDKEVQRYSNLLKVPNEMTSEKL